jgi:hypothetical protein
MPLLCSPDGEDAEQMALVAKFWSDSPGLYNELLDRRLRRGVFTSVAELEAAILLWADKRTTTPSRSTGRPQPPTSSRKSSEAGPP